MIILILCLSSVLSSGPMSDSPLEVGLGVSLDKGVDGSNTSSGTRMVSGLWSVGWGASIGHWGIPSDSVNWGIVLSIIKEEYTARGGTNKGKEDNLWTLLKHHFTCQLYFMLSLTTLVFIIVAM